MKNKEMIISPPTGWEIDLKKSNLTQNKIVYKEIEKEIIPKSWEDLEKIKGYWISDYSRIFYISDITTKGSYNKNIIPTKSLIKASLAQAQLLQLRNKVWENLEWKPDWKTIHYKYVIENYENNELRINRYVNTNRWLSFPFEEIAEEFLEIHRSLIEQAKELL